MYCSHFIYLAVAYHTRPLIIFVVFGKITIGVSRLEMKPNAENSVFLFFEEKYKE
jgi:hypothetical protein